MSSKNEIIEIEKEKLFGLVEGFCGINDIPQKEEERIKRLIEKEKREEENGKGGMESDMRYVYA